MQKRDHMSSEMQSHMQKLMMKIRQQDELIQEFSNAKRVELETPHLQEVPSPQHPAASPSLFNLSHTDPSPFNPSLPRQSKSGRPLPVSIATPKATSHHCADAPMPPYYSLCVFSYNLYLSLFLDNFFMLQKSYKVMQTDIFDMVW